MGVSPAYIFLAICIFLYNFYCYRRKKLIYAIKHKTIFIVDDKCYELQFKYEKVITMIFVLIGIANMLIDHKMTAPISFLTAIILYWVLIFRFEDVAYKKGYIECKNE